MLRGRRRHRRRPAWPGPRRPRAPVSRAAQRWPNRSLRHQGTATAPIRRDLRRRVPGRIFRPCSPGLPQTLRAKAANPARTEGCLEWAESARADSRAPRRGWRPGPSLAPPILDIPAAEALFWRLWHLALPPPWVEPVVDGEARQVLDCEPRRRYRCAIEAGLAHHLADDADRLLLDERQLIALGHDLSPFVDLLVDVDLDRADIGAAAVAIAALTPAGAFYDGDRTNPIHITGKGVLLRSQGTRIRRQGCRYRSGLWI